MVISDCIHVAANGLISIFIMDDWYSIMCVCVWILLIYSSVDGCLSCVHVLAIVNSATMNRDTCVFFEFFELCIFFSYKL